jgi:rhodanese-related sulfurtransferase
VPLPELRERFAEIPRQGLVVLYCGCPADQLRDAYLFLRGHGYRNLAVLDGDYAGWVARGYPVER